MDSPDRRATPLASALILPASAAPTKGISARRANRLPMFWATADERVMRRSRERHAMEPTIACRVRPRFVGLHRGAQLAFAPLLPSSAQGPPESAPPRRGIADPARSPRKHAAAAPPCWREGQVAPRTAAPWLKVP